MGLRQKNLAHGVTLTTSNKCPGCGADELEANTCRHPNCEFITEGKIETWVPIGIASENIQTGQRVEFCLENSSVRINRQNKKGPG